MARLKDVRVGQSFRVSGFQNHYMRIAKEGSDGTEVILYPSEPKCRPKFETIPVVCLEDGPHRGDIRSFPADHLVVVTSD
jgi:hypothetical protein